MLVIEELKITYESLFDWLETPFKSSAHKVYIQMKQCFLLEDEELYTYRNASVNGTHKDRCPHSGDHMPFLTS